MLPVISAHADPAAAGVLFRPWPVDVVEYSMVERQFRSNHKGVVCLTQFVEKWIYLNKSYKYEHPGLFACDGMNLACSFIDPYGTTIRKIPRHE
jgi:hypothetical protein